MKRIILMLSLIMASFLLVSAGNAKKTQSHKQKGSLTGKFFILQAEAVKDRVVFFQFIPGNILVTGTLNNTTENENGCEYFATGSYYYSPKTGAISMNFDGTKITGTIYWINSEKFKMKTNKGPAFIYFAEAYSDYDVIGEKYKDAFSKLTSFELNILSK